MASRSSSEVLQIAEIATAEAAPAPAPSLLHRFWAGAVDSLREEDVALTRLLEKEYQRQSEVLAMVASCSPAHPSALVCEGSFVSNVTAEGYPGKRFHAGCVNVDAIEQLAIERA